MAILSIRAQIERPQTAATEVFKVDRWNVCWTRPEKWGFRSENKKARSCLDWMHLTASMGNSVRGHSGGEMGRGGEEKEGKESRGEERRKGEERREERTALRSCSDYQLPPSLFLYLLISLTLSLSFGRVFQEDVFWVTLRKFDCGCCYCSVAAMKTPVGDCARCTLPGAAVINSLASDLEICCHGWHRRDLWPDLCSDHATSSVLILLLRLTPTVFLSFFFSFPSMWLPCLYFPLGSFSTVWICIFLTLYLSPQPFSVLVASSSGFIPRLSGQFIKPVLLLCDTWMDGGWCVGGVGELGGVRMRIRPASEYKGTQRSFYSPGRAQNTAQRTFYIHEIVTLGSRGTSLTGRPTFGCFNQRLRPKS